MRNKIIMTIATSIIFNLTALQAQEKRIKRSDLPPAVEHTVAAQSQGATIQGFSQEQENGQTYYEAEMDVDGHTKDVLINKDGAVVEVEEEIPVGALPPDAKKGLQDRVGTARVVKVESLTKHGKVVAYEVQIVSKGKKREVQVGPDGKALEHEE